jgi:intracellular multiplication protein IcmP
MPAQQGGGGGNGNDDSLGILWFMGAVFAVGWIIWHFGHHHLKAFFIAVRQLEIDALAFFLRDNATIVALKGHILSLSPGALTPQNSKSVSAALGYYWRWPIVAFCIIGMILMLRHARYKKVHTMQTLLDQESLDWPQVGIVKKLDLAGTPIDQGPWAMALSPLQFAKKYHLLKVEKIPDGKAAWRGSDKYKMTVEKDRAQRLFSVQLGPIFTHPLRMPSHAQALFALFAARAAHDVKTAVLIQRHLALSAAQGKVDYSLAKKYVMKYFKDKAVERCMQRHGYIITMMASMLELGRTDGVLASADFLWLKPIDRRLWYMLNGMGRQVAFAEVAGAVAHWRVEKELERPLSVPVVDMAVVALEEALGKVLYQPDTEE